MCLFSSEAYISQVYYVSNFFIFFKIQICCVSQLLPGRRRSSDPVQDRGQLYRVDEAHVEASGCAYYAVGHGYPGRDYQLVAHRRGEYCRGVVRAVLDGGNYTNASAGAT